MSYYEVDKIVTAALEDLRELVSDYRNSLLGGDAENHAAYMYMVGYLKGADDAGTCLIREAQKYYKDLAGDNDGTGD